MRHLLSICGVIAICVVMGLGFMLVRRSKAALEPGILTSQINALAAGWESGNIPATDRLVNIIISDAEADALAHNLSERDRRGEESGARSALESEILSIADKPPVWKRTMVWFKRTFLRKTMSASEDSYMAESLGNIQNAVAWTHNGFESASEEEMARELMKAIIKGNDAGAHVNIITQGISAVPALKAIKRLEGVERKGKSLEVNKLLALDMNKPTLQKINFGYFGKFSRPGNLKEWVNVWKSPSPPHTRKIELFSRNHDGTWFYADKIFPEIGLRTINEPKPRATVAEHDVLEFAQAMIKGGWLKEEMEKAEKEDRQAAQKEKRPDEKRTKTTGHWRKQGNEANCKGNPLECDWYDAMAYCGGRLPTVSQLQSMYQAECTGWRRPDTCDHFYWSSEETSDSNARGVGFYVGHVGESGKHSGGGHVRCQQKKTDVKIGITSRDIVGHAYNQKPAQDPQDSMFAMIKGGWLKEEMEKAEKEDRQAVQEEKRPAEKRTKTTGDWRKQGNEANCKGNPPRCDWYDAMAYCGGRLPTVSQLQSMRQAECTGGRDSNTCYGWYWSSEETSDSYARLVDFSHGYVYEYPKGLDYYYVRCR